MFNRTAASPFPENSSSAAAAEGGAAAGQEYSLVFEFIIPGVLLNTIGEEILYRG